MKTITNNVKINKRALAVIVLLVLSGANMFGQVKSQIVVPVEIAAVEIAAEDAAASQMELVSWLMGERQSQVSNAANAEAKSSEVRVGKKQFINNGVSANRILSRAFLKKANNYHVAIA